MIIAIRDVDGVAVLDLSGKFTRGDDEEVLRTSVDRLLVEGRRQILVNLANVPYMDSRAIGELVMVHKRAVASGGTVKLLNPLKRVYDVLQLVKLDKVFETYLDQTAAIASFRAPR